MFKYELYHSEKEVTTVGLRLSYKRIASYYDLQKH